MTEYLKAQLKAPISNVEEHFPNVISPAPEIQQVAKNINGELNILWETLYQWTLGNFVYDTDTTTIQRWEKMYGLQGNEHLPLEDRQFAILSHEISDRPYTHRKLDKILTSLCGPGNYTISLDYSHYAIDIYINLGMKFQQEIVKKALFKIIPANLLFSVSLKYNRHMDLQRYTHGKMNSLRLTHFNLKEDVLPDA